MGKCVEIGDNFFLVGYEYAFADDGVECFCIFTNNSINNLTPPIDADADVDYYYDGRKGRGRVEFSTGMSPDYECFGNTNFPIAQELLMMYKIGVRKHCKRLEKNGRCGSSEYCEESEGSDSEGKKCVPKAGSPSPLSLSNLCKAQEPATTAPTL